MVIFIINWKHKLAYNRDAVVAQNVLHQVSPVVIRQQFWQCENVQQIHSIVNGQLQNWQSTNTQKSLAYLFHRSHFIITAI